VGISNLPLSYPGWKFQRQPYKHSLLLYSPKISIFTACTTFTSCIKLSKLRFGARLRQMDGWRRKAVTWESSINRLEWRVVHTNQEELLFIVRRQDSGFRSEIAKPTSLFHSLWVLVLIQYTLSMLRSYSPTTVAARSKAWTVFAPSNAGIMGSNPNQGIDVCVCVYSKFVLFCVQAEALRRADPPSKESYRLCRRSRNWKKWPRPNKGL
jgi:hypothetical protein